MVEIRAESSSEVSGGPQADLSEEKPLRILARSASANRASSGVSERVTRASSSEEMRSDTGMNALPFSVSLRLSQYNNIFIISDFYMIL